MKKNIYKIENMDCASCAALIEMELEDLGVIASCSYPKKTLEIKNMGSVSEEKIKDAVKKAGYNLATSN